MRGERGDHEVEPLQPRRRDAEDQPNQRGDDARERDREEHRNVCFVGDVGRGEGAEQEEGGVPDRNLAGEADQDVQTERRDRENADLDQDAEPIAAEKLRHEAEQQHAGDRKVAAGRGREDRGVGRVRGAEITSRDEGGAGHESDPFDVVGAEQAVGLDHQHDDEDVERRDLVEIAPVKVFAVDILRDVLE